MSAIDQAAAGVPHPLGATVANDGVNFSLFSHYASGVELLLFDRADQAEPTAMFELDPERNRTGSYWHVFAPGVKAGQLYGYRVRGPYEPAEGLRFDAAKLLLDPYARAVVDDQYDRGTAGAYGVDNAATAMKCVVVDTGTYDWEGDEPFGKPYRNAAIYELHVRGFTRHPSSGVTEQKRGTYAGLIEKIPYLKQLGVKVVELMPVHQYDAQSAPGGRPNYWGYEPVAYFAPHRAYSSRKDALGPVDEFRDMVKALHRAGIEVVLDVVFNHTAEDNEDGPTLSLRGIDNRIYYLLDPQNRAAYINDSGVGNTVNVNETVVRRMILDSLRYWVREMHVDGFRFDLGAVLSRGEDNRPTPYAPILWDIDSDPVLAGTRIIGEAWDAAGLYEVGSFAGDRWAVWNGRFRDTVRRFVKSDRGTVRDLADVVSGSGHVFSQAERNPQRSINFITAHDGFTLNDLVSYNEKHNEANGESNRDGNNENDSWNCGSEGSSDDPQVEGVRRQQLRNFFTLLFLSQGQPMFVMGDEVRRTQQGNNNAYCQDNEISWFDWNLVEKNGDLLRFVSGLLRFRQRSALYLDPNYWSDAGGTDIRWHGVQRNAPDWGDNSHSLAFELMNDEAGEHLYVALNAYWEPLVFALPALPEGRRWARIIDTARATPGDFCEPPVADSGPRAYELAPRAALVLTEEAET